jgi:hypothetical protein
MLETRRVPPAKTFSAEPVLKTRVGTTGTSAENDRVGKFLKAGLQPIRT